MILKYKENAKEQLPNLEHAVLESGAKFPYLQYPALTELGFVNHCFTTRMGGVSEGIFSSLNLSFSRGDDRDAVYENYRRVASMLGTTEANMVCSDQTHTTNVRHVTRADAGCGVTREKGYTDVDGLITDTPGIVLSTFYADCVPLFFVDPTNRAIGLAHSGWRGTVNRMGQVTLARMAECFGTKAKDVIVAIGPSICRDCYEVSLDVAQAFSEEFAGDAKNSIVTEKEPVNGERKFLLDLWKANEQIFLDAGVLPHHISTTALCTCCNEQVLFSHRASKGMRGNLGAFLMIKE